MTNDVLRRAFHTFWQAFLGALALAYGASGLDVSQVSDMASAKKFAAALGVAALSALLSAAKTTAASMVARRSVKRASDTGPGSLVDPVAHQPEHAA